MSTIVGTCSIPTERLDAGHAGSARPGASSRDGRLRRGAVAVAVMQLVADVEDHLPRRQRVPAAVAGQTAVQRPHRCR